MKKIFIVSILLLSTCAQADKLKQGEAQLTIDGKTITLTSSATTISENFGNQVEDQLETQKGEETLNSANNKTNEINVEKSDVVDFAKSLEGKTLYDSTARYMMGQNYLTLSFLAGEKSLRISIETDEALTQNATNVDSLIYQPTQANLLAGYQIKNPTLKITRLETIDERALAITGEIIGENIKHLDLMKGKATGEYPDIKTLSVKFNLDYVPIKK